MLVFASWLSFLLACFGRRAQDRQGPSQPDAPEWLLERFAQAVVGKVRAMPEIQWVSRKMETEASRGGVATTGDDRGEMELYPGELPPRFFEFVVGDQVRRADPLQAWIAIQNHPTFELERIGEGVKEGHLWAWTESIECARQVFKLEPWSPENPQGATDQEAFNALGTFLDFATDAKKKLDRPVNSRRGPDLTFSDPSGRVGDLQFTFPSPESETSAPSSPSSPTDGKTPDLMKIFLTPAPPAPTT